MKVLYYDIETSKILAWVWGMYDQNITYDDVVQDWHIICAAWKWEGESAVHSIAAKGKNDKAVVKKLHSLLSSADVIVAHNGDKFDYKKVMARVIELGLDPLPPVTSVDTLKMARKAAFTSRKLDDLAAKLNLSRKIRNEPGLWQKASEGDQEAISKLETYCRGDIPPLEDLYFHLRPHVITQVNYNLYADRPCCPTCKSERMQSRGTRKTKTSAYQSWQCQDCGAWSQSTPRLKGSFFK